MRIIFLTQYFPPEVGSTQNRIYDLAVRFLRNGADVTVLTAMPNYPEMVIHPEYRGKWFCRERMSGLKVIRAALFVRKGRRNLLLRLLSYFSFTLTSLLVGLFSLRRSDFIFCDSPPLFLGISAYVLSRAKRARLIFNVADLMPESAERLGLVRSRTLLWLSRKLEEFMYEKSFLVSGQTRGIVRNISSRFPAKTVHLLRNGVDVSLFNAEEVGGNWRLSNGLSRSDFVLLYAGILGFAQGLEVILMAASRLKDFRAIKFVFIGSGPLKEELLNLKDELDLPNVRFLDVCPRNRMPEIIASCDAGIVPLRKLDLFKSAIPSKLFEYLAMKKPILLGIEGEAEDLVIHEGRAGLSYVPEDDQDLARQVLRLYESDNLAETLGDNGLRYVSKNFDRRAIFDDFWQVLRHPGNVS